MYRTGTPPELERKPSYNTLEIGEDCGSVTPPCASDISSAGGKSAKFLTRSGSLGSRHRLIPSSQFSPSSNPFSENRLANPNKRALLSRTESGSLRIGTLLNLTHVIVTMALLVTCTVLYRDRLIKADFIDACEKDHVTTRHELELSLDELSRYKILQNTFHTVPTPPTKCPECPSVRTPHYPVPGTKKKAVSTAQVDNSNVIALKRLIEERDDLEKKLKTAHLKASPGFTKIIESYRASESLLIEVIQAMSAELLALKYGPGPYYAEFVLGFASVDIAPKHILIELAAKEMPYTTLYFMTQLEAGMWRGCHVNFNPGHILLADPNVLPIYPGRFEEIVGACQRASFNGVPYADSEGHLAFREYADSKPHVPFTLGIPGRFENIFLFQV